PGCRRRAEGLRARGAQLYDTPCEEWAAVGEGRGEPPTRDSRLPRHDERPADEYDQPWEWKQDHISRAFAGGDNPREVCPTPLMVPVARRVPHAADGSRGPPMPCAGGYPVPRCPPPPRRWYHGPIGRAGAESLLALCREGSFLVRDCETSPEDYSLSLRSSHGFVHVKLTRTREHHFVLGRAGAAFPSVPEAVRHYTARALPVRGARHLSLLYPVPVQPL
ncbi:SHF protein, partial [Urocolius indicus]|nr:SHF protein [Urocolius indicus]